MLIFALVIGIASFIGYTWAKGQGWSYFNENNSELISNNVEALAIDKEERVWVGTRHGLSVLGTDGKWTDYLAGIEVTALATDAQGQTWVGTDEGLSVFTPDGGMKTYTTSNSDLASDRIISLAVDTHGQVWIGTSDGLNLLSPDGTWKVYTTLNSDLPDDSILALGVDPQDRVWVGTSGGLIVISPDGQWQAYTGSDIGLMDDLVSNLAVGADGSVSAGAGFDGNGLGVLSPAGQWRVYTPSNSGLASDDVRALAFDTGGSLWVGNEFESSGLSELTTDGHWRRYSRVNSGLLNNNVNTLAPGKPGSAELLVGSWNGLTVYHPAASVPQSVILGLLLLGLLSIAALIIQVVIYAGMALEKKRQKKLVSPEAESPLEVAIALPQADMRRKYIQFAGGFLGWYLVNGLLYQVLFLSDIDEEMALLFGLAILPINLILLVVLSIKHRTRFIGLGILSAMAVNLFVALVFGLGMNAQCFIPFFIGWGW
jgi:hypothetical protein